MPKRKLVENPTEFDIDDIKVRWDGNQWVVTRSSINKKGEKVEELIGYYAHIDSAVRSVMYAKLTRLGKTTAIDLLKAIVDLHKEVKKAWKIPTNL